MVREKPLRKRVVIVGIFFFFFSAVQAQDKEKTYDVTFADGHTEKLVIIDDDPFHVRKRFLTFDPIFLKIVQDGAKGPFGLCIKYLRYDDSLRSGLDWSLNVLPIDSKFFENDGERPRAPQIDGEFGYSFFFKRKETTRKKWINFQNDNLHKVYRVKIPWRAEKLVGLHLATGYLHQCVNYSDLIHIGGNEYGSINFYQMVYLSAGIRRDILQNFQFRGNTFVGGTAFLHKCIYLDLIYSPLFLWYGNTETREYYSDTRFTVQNYSSGVRLKGHITKKEATSFGFRLGAKIMTSLVQHPSHGIGFSFDGIWWPGIPGTNLLLNIGFSMVFKDRSKKS
jgi:hypothetical protein